MLTRYTDAQANYSALTMPTLVLTDKENYPQQIWRYNYAHPTNIIKLQPLLKAAYPNLDNTYTNTADLALYWAGQIEVTQWLIAFATELGLVHFGRFKTEGLRDIFRLEFSQPEKRNEHLRKLGWQLSNWPQHERLDVIIKNLSINYFIDQFWSNEINEKLKAQARKNGLTLAGMDLLLKQQERKLESILGDQRSTFDLLVASILNN